MTRRRIRAGGAAITDAGGRPAAIQATTCLAIVDDRSGIRRCSRRGWFGLRSPDGEVVQPLCSTHLHRLARFGGEIEQATVNPGAL